MQYIKLTYVSFRAHVKIASRIVSYRVGVDMQHLCENITCLYLNRDSDCDSIFTCHLRVNFWCRHFTAGESFQGWLEKVLSLYNVT